MRAASTKSRDESKPPTYKPIANLPRLSEEEVALRENIALNGVLVPIVVDSAGARRGIIDGNYRKRIADELGYECPEVVQSGLSDEEKRTLARALNLARRQLNQEQKRAIITDQLRESSQRSNRWIAKRLGVSHHTVQSVRAGLSSGGQIAHVDFVEGEDGKQYPPGPPGRNLGRGDAGRVPLDYYGTPPPAIEALLARERFRGTVWEPACGDGRALTIMRAHGCRAIGSDLQTGVDFLKTRRKVEHIVTNPPYYLALDFVQHAKRPARRKGGSTPTARFSARCQSF